MSAISVFAFGLRVTVALDCLTKAFCFDFGILRLRAGIKCVELDSTEFTGSLKVTISDSGAISLYQLKGSLAYGIRGIIPFLSSRLLAT